MSGRIPEKDTGAFIKKPHITQNPRQFLLEKPRDSYYLDKLSDYYLKIHLTGIYWMFYDGAS